MLKYLVLFFVLVFSNCLAQREGNIWCFGDSVLVDWNDALNPTFGRSISKNRGSASSISDSIGNLLFYCGNISGAVISECTINGGSEVGYVYTKDHTVMENGNCVSGEAWYEEKTIIPMPGNDSLYYVFTANLYAYNEMNAGIDYCIIDMNANNGLGKVIERDVSAVNLQTIGNNPISWCIKAIKNGNGRDWWLVSRTTENNAEGQFFLKLLVTPEGIEVEQVPVVEPYCQTGFSFGSFSKDGTKYCSVCPEYPFGNIVIYDFDRCTGEFFNQKIIEETIAIPEDSVNYDVYFSAEFSPNNRYLYINNVNVDCVPEKRIFLFQYDLDDEFPALTRDTVMDYIEPNQYTFRQGGILKLAPDNKIYYSRPFDTCYGIWWPYPDSIYTEANTYLSVINNPDSAYPACNFTPYSFYLGGARTYHGLPNNPNFALGAMEGTPCDTLSTSVRELKSYKNNQLNIFPNPCYNSCQIQYKPAKSISNIAISNMEGKVIFKEENIPVTLLQHGYEINTFAFAKGIYFVSLISGNDNVVKKMVKL
jgi:Secretion system C-terminal sorting domain